MAWLRAVVTIHPPGLGGTPASAQRCTAMTNASWTASSARSMSPKRRTSVATARPNSARKVCSTADTSVAGTVGPLLLHVVLEGAHFDGSLARRRRLARQRQRGVEVGNL